jgi:N-formylglutamate amidohydrolase
MPQRERAAILAELTPPYAIRRPREQTAPFVFCSPHSGRVYPSVLMEASRLDARTLRRSEDCYVDELFEGVAALGAPLISARFPRAYLDVNREPYELDPELIRGALPAFANTSSIRVLGGLGTIARIVADGEEIYREPPTVGAALERVELLYRPFHAAVAGLIEATLRRFGIAFLVDCHSMPSASMAQSSRERPDIVLGDRFGTACDPAVTRQVRDVMTSEGYQVQLNRPYAGGFITEHYGRPGGGVHALQVEINRGLYLDEASFSPTAGFDPLRRRLEAIAARLFRDLPQTVGRRAAAE